MPTFNETAMATRLTDYAQLTKLRLSLLVVFSAGMAYLIGSGGETDWSRFTLLLIGGFLVTGSANAFNQVIEKDLDKLMDRTLDRPLPGARMQPREALILATVLGVAGLYILFRYMNMASGILGFAALISYTIMYTPMKKISPFAVFIGAIPGAIPPLLGYVAAADRFDTAAWVLFSIQFLWQFPHFWAIAWVLDDDYRKAGFELLPSPGGRDRSSAFQAFVYSFSLVPAGIMPYMFHMAGVPSLVIITLSGMWFAYLAWQLYRHCTTEKARKLMFGSFIYLPIVQLALVFDKI